MSDPQHVPQLPQEETVLIRVWHERGYGVARQEAASGEGLGPDLVVPPPVRVRSGLRRTVVGRLERERDGRLVEDIALRPSR